MGSSRLADFTGDLVMGLENNDMILFHPWLLLLIVPVAVFLWSAKETTPKVVWFVRIFAAMLIVFGISNPNMRLTSVGKDIVIVVDRSDSMAAGSQQSSVETIQQIESTMTPDDRI